MSKTDSFLSTRYFTFLGGIFQQNLFFKEGLIETRFDKIHQFKRFQFTFSSEYFIIVCGVFSYKGKEQKVKRFRVENR
ncbi:hypothetical protein HLI_17970 [Halobacillus litoralis]|uniref:Uncharacterized protein n=1 Tax=Halobacillus litoralis TaxID=45668 RepID=A0A410MH02_9BACI|nr:hypothetical protein HLI_17970 [Halobacillus litoralis]